METVTTGVHAAEQAFADAAHGSGDGVIGAALARNDLGAGGTHVLVDLLVVQIHHDALLQLDQILVVLQINGGNFRDGPGHKAGLAVLAEYVGMHVLLGNGQIFRDAGAQTGGIQQGAAADDPILGNAGHLAENISQNVHGVGHDHVSGVGTGAHDVGGDGLDDVDVGVHQIHTGLARACGPRRR